MYTFISKTVTLLCKIRFFSIKTTFSKFFKFLNFTSCWKAPNTYSFTTFLITKKNTSISQQLTRHELEVIHIKYCTYRIMCLCVYMLHACVRNMRQSVNDKWSKITCFVQRFIDLTC